MKKSVVRIIAVIMSMVLVLSLSACSSTSKETKNKNTYADELEAMGIFDNTINQALPQTIIHKLIMEHLEAPLPGGKTAKKAIFIGYDGYRADGIENVKNMDNSAIMYVKSLGGLYHSFSGGIEGGEIQATSTAPSWMAMLTGGWADYNGVDNNSQSKNDAKTFLTKATEMGYTGSFTTSWREHTQLSYFPDIVNSITNGLPIEYTHQIDDEATYYQVLKYVAKPDSIQKTAKEDPDVIFFTLEHGDHTGHDSGYGNQNDAYIQACKDADSWGYNIIKTIEARSTYDTEDWLIVVSTDHGGTGKGHGDQSVFERSTWIACNKPIEMTDENLNFANK